MKIHLISTLFAPDELAGASLYTDLALFLKDRGHDVRVTTTFSYYPAWKLRPEDVGCATREETFRQIPVRRLSMHVPAKPGGASRIATELSFLWSLVSRGTFADWTPDVVVTGCPLLAQCVAQRILYAGKNIPRLIVVHDFPIDAASELAILNIGGLARVLGLVERWALGSADTLVTISEGMLEKLRRRFGSSQRRLVLIPNWIHGSLQRAIDAERGRPCLRVKNQLFYSGNIGVKQGLAAAARDFARASSGWSLKIHGGGAASQPLQDEAGRNSSIILGPVLEEAEYVRSLLGTTACLITQQPGLGANFLPSKLLPAMATGTPVLAICDPESCLGREVLEGQFGVVVRPGDVDGLRSVVAAWDDDPNVLEQLGARAAERSHLYERETVLQRYEAELERLVTAPVA